jgi:hypothetical protein
MEVGPLDSSLLAPGQGPLAVLRLWRFALRARGAFGSRFLPREM